MSAPVSSPSACPACAAPASGRFCAGCGAPLQGAACAGCRAALTPGAKFCHRCGTAAGAAAPGVTRAPSGMSNALPWAVAGIALLALIALVAGQRIGANRPGADLPNGPIAAAPLGASAGAPRAPDISNMSPRERADRLFNRVMQLSSEGKADSVQFLAPMAVAAHQMVTPADADLRYDLGRIGEVTGVPTLARAQADTILSENPTHLLGLILAASSARAAGDEAAARAFEARLLAARDSELRRNLIEYQRHNQDIVNAIADARARQ